MCPLAYLKNHVTKLHKMFYTYHLWSWLGPPSTTVQQVIYFRFCEWRRVTVTNYEFKRMPVGPSTAKPPLVGGSVVAHYFLQWRHADDVFILVTCSMRYKSRGAKFAVCDCFVLAIENHHFWKCSIFHLRYNWQRKGSYALIGINLYFVELYLHN